MPPERLKLMADYHCFPLWEVGGRNVSPDELPLTHALRHALGEWSATFDRTLNQAYPPDSRFDSQEAEKAFEVEGIRLWTALQSELGSSYKVVYFSVKTRRLFEEVTGSQE